MIVNKPDKLTNRTKIDVKCDQCNKPGHTNYRSYRRSLKKHDKYLCLTCSVSTDRYKKLKQEYWTEGKRAQLSIAQKGRKHTEETKNKIARSIRLTMTDDKKECISKTSKKLWEDKEFRNKVEPQLKSLWDNPDIKAKAVEGIKKHSTRFSELSKERWKNPEFRKRMMCSLANMPRVSSLQTQLYSVLDDLNIQYHREYNDREDDSQCKIGPYSFDCVIPTKDKTLLIECQGDYWHSLDVHIINDKQKSSYIANNFPDHEMKYLWEHEFKCKDKIVELIKYWLGMTDIELIEFDFKNVDIKECPAKDYKLLLSKYHYLPNAGRGGIAHGAYLNEELIAVCVFSPLGRQNLPWDKKSTRELSRLCIHPRYQKKNFASWFVSRCIKRLNSKYRTIISYCDTTFNHDGAIYKACNFRLDGKVKPDYWYRSEDGWIMHKKTLYDHAVKMSMTEKKFAIDNEYKRVYGKEKLRFIYGRS
jgi:hypothetical protein